MDQFQDAGLPVFSHPDHPPCQVAKGHRKGHREVAAAFTDGDSVYGQDAEPLVVGFDGCSLALGTDNPPVLTPNPDTGRGEVQVPER